MPSDRGVVTVMHRDHDCNALMPDHPTRLYRSTARPPREHQLTVLTYGEANATTANKFADLALLYEYIANALTSSASAYRKAESDATSRLNAAGKGA